MDHLEYLKAGFEDAQKRFQVAQQKMQVMQAEFNLIAQEFNAWQTLLRAEQAKLNPVGPQIAVLEPPKAKNESNQTDAVRELLKQRPGGMTPSDIWKEIGSGLSNRAYLYSVLKRLRDKGDAIERRGKYYLKPRSDSEVQHVVQ
jgi:hypothetical protein